MWALKRARMVGCVSKTDRLFGLLGLLGQKYSLDVRQNSTLGDGYAGEQFVELLIVTDGELKMTGNDPGLLVVTGSVSCKLENLSCEVLHDGSEVHWGTSSNSLTIVSFPQKTMDTSYWELKTSPAGTGLGLSLCLSSFTASRHDEYSLLWVSTGNNVAKSSVSAYI
mgnify:CR=1 FL=1